MLFKWPPADEEGPSARNHGEIVAVVVLRGCVVMGEVCDSVITVATIQMLKSTLSAEPRAGYSKSLIVE